MPLIVVAYDIPHDRRRVRLHSLLLGFGEPVQESLFECDLDDAALRRLRKRITRLMRPGDNVRIYPLCASCADRTDNGLGERLERAPDIYVV
jgi:CRISPR-associated protein Cas2